MEPTVMQTSNRPGKVKEEQVLASGSFAEDE